VFWSDDDEGYIAVVPDLPGCSPSAQRPRVELGDRRKLLIERCQRRQDWTGFAGSLINSALDRAGSAFSEARLGELPGPDPAAKARLTSRPI